MCPGSVNSVGYMTFSVMRPRPAPRSRPWNYTSGLAIYQGTNAQQDNWFVKWSPDLLFSGLNAGEKLVPRHHPGHLERGHRQQRRPADQRPTPPAWQHHRRPGEERAGSPGSTPGQEVQIENAAGKVVAKVDQDSPAAQHRRGEDDHQPDGAGRRRGRGEAARRARWWPSSRPPGTSWRSRTTPATTWTTRCSPGSPPAPPSRHHLDGAAEPGHGQQPRPDGGLPGGADRGRPRPAQQRGRVGGDNTFENDFAQSCNNAFSSFWNQVTGTQLINTAQTYYGFNTPWNIGLNQFLTAVLLHRSRHRARAHRRGAVSDFLHFFGPCFVKIGAALTLSRVGGICE